MAENDNNVPIQNNTEVDEAFQKRLIMSQNARKKKKIAIIIISIISLIVIITLISISVVKNNRRIEYNNKLRNMATEEMNEDYMNVYADVLTIKPMYYSGNPYYYRSSYFNNNDAIENVICKCKTVEGKTIWASFFYQSYPGYDSFFVDENSFKDQSYSSSNPLRLKGRIELADSVADNLEDKIGNVYVLSVDIKN